MSKSDVHNFLKKELKKLARKRGDTVIKEQETFDDVSAKGVRVKSKTKKQHA